MDKMVKVAKNVVIDGAWEKLFAKHAELFESGISRYSTQQDLRENSTVVSVVTNYVGSRFVPSFEMPGYDAVLTDHRVNFNRV